MPENNHSELPPRAHSSTRWSRKWATLGGCGTSTTVLSSDESDQPLKSQGQRTSSSLFRKSSTISRTYEPTKDGITDEISNPSLKKSCSLMNVLRSKLHSPTVLRRFRSKSRENSKSILNDDQQTTTNPEKEQVRRKKSFSIPKSSSPNDDEPETAVNRRSRKRDPSPIRRFANRIVQLTRHHTSTERKTPEPSSVFCSILFDLFFDGEFLLGKTNTIDSRDEGRAPNEVEHINACYDEIRAKYFDSTGMKSSSSPLTNPDDDEETMINHFQEKHLPPLPDDPLLQARKQANMKLNCMLSGYSLRSPFSTHERVFTDHHLFKFHHYHDVGKRKYDWNMTNENNRIFNSMRARPISRSIDNFRQPNINGL